jgi:hypothetical protein
MSLLLGGITKRGGAERERETVALLLPVALLIWESKMTISVVKEAETIRGGEGEGAKVGAREGRAIL